MDFRLIECPKCKKKYIVGYQICREPCQCGVYLNEKEHYKKAEKEYARGIVEFVDTFEKFETYMKEWRAENIEVEYKTVSIPDKVLLKLVENEKKN